MKFIHTGDIHYGMRPDVSKPWAKERYTAVKEVLGKIVDECRKGRLIAFLFPVIFFTNSLLIRI